MAVENKINRIRELMEEKNISNVNLNNFITFGSQISDSEADSIIRDLERAPFKTTEEIEAEKTEIKAYLEREQLRRSFSVGDKVQTAAGIGIVKKVRSNIIDVVFEDGRKGQYGMKYVKKV